MGAGEGKCVTFAWALRRADVCSPQIPTPISRPEQPKQMPRTSTIVSFKGQDHRKSHTYMNWRVLASLWTVD